MSREIKTIQDVRLMVGMGHRANGDPLQRLWRIHRNGKRKGKAGPLEKHYGKEYAQSTPE